MNTKSLEELWIPRHLLSGVSSIEEPVVIVGLMKELEYREGIVVPRVQRVIEMPRAVNDVPRPAANRLAARPSGQLAPVVGIQVESSPESRKSRKLLGVVAAGILASIIGTVVFRDGPLSSRARFFSATPRLSLPFTAHDDYLSVVDRWGRPASSRSRPSTDGREFHLLRYPERLLTIVLLGADRDHAFYLGALGRGGRVVHSVTLPDGHDSAALLTRAR